MNINCSSVILHNVLGIPPPGPVIHRVCHPILEVELIRIEFGVELLLSVFI